MALDLLSFDKGSTYWSVVGCLTLKVSYTFFGISWQILFFQRAFILRINSTAPMLWWCPLYKPLFVFLTGDPKQNVNSFMTPFSDSVFYALSHGSLGFVLHGSTINRHCKDSYWLLKNFDQSENGWKSYHGKQNRGYHVKEHKKLNQKMVS